MSTHIPETVSAQVISTFLPSSGRGSSGPHLQLEVWGDVEESADGWLQAHITQRARALQGEGLQDGSEEEPQLRPGQAFSQAHPLPWQGGLESAMPTSGPTGQGEPTETGTDTP